MNILLVGYGKMGRELEKIIFERGHNLIGTATKENPLNKIMLHDVDMAIDFSTPESVIHNIEFLMQNKIPAVVGTTGWYNSIKNIKNLVEETGGALLYASNFSIGVQLFFQLNEQLAKLMRPYKDYTPEIEEIHHTEKLDKPSGTAITLAKDLINNYTNLQDWYLHEGVNKGESKLSIKSIRKTDVKGIHKVEYNSSIDTISIRHEAHNRKGFALGAIIAAEWLQHKKGMFTMKDVLQFY